jgi:D-sedoheptulose 7-phosphate isomerase
LNQGDYRTYVEKIFENTIRAHQESKCLSEQIAVATVSIIHSLDNGGKLLIMGNGGSASDASHLAAEFVSRFKRKRLPLPAVALTADNSLITAIANDFGFDEIFARQCSALARPGDVVIAISTSGASLNVLKAVQQCKTIGSITTIALSGNPGNKLAALVDIPIIVPSSSTPIIQNVHRTILHALCDLVDVHYAEE